MTELDNRFLSEVNARAEGVATRWSATNEQWWDWYMSLAVNEAPPRALEPGSPLPSGSAPSLDAVRAELDAPLEVSDAARRQFWTDGFVKLSSLASEEALFGLRSAFERLFSSQLRPEMAFPSLELMWLHDPWCRAFVLSRRLASAAAELLGVDAVRIYHDNALSKLPGCGRTPWHYDAHHYPIASTEVVTLWMPLQPTGPAMGSLSFARGIERWRLVEDLTFDKFGTGYDAAIIDRLAAAEAEVVPVEYELGEATFHHTHALHSAGPNRTTTDRMALATTYFADGARLLDSPTMVSGDFEKFMPGVAPGAVIASERNPVVWSRS